MPGHRQRLGELGPDVRKFQGGSWGGQRTGVPAGDWPMREQDTELVRDWNVQADGDHGIRNTVK